MTPASSPVRLLLVEDNPADAELVQEFLAANSDSLFEVAHVTRLAAVEEGLKEASDCVLLDLGLPDSEGLDTLRSVRALDGDVAIVVLTGQDDEQLGLTALQEGAQDYLVKGQVNAWILRRALKYAVERKRMDLARSQFIARAAHELRTPLAVLAGLAETVGQHYEHLGQEQRDKAFAALARQGERARTLINNLLDLSQLEAGQLKLVLQPVSLGVMGRELGEELPPPEGKTFESRIDEEVWALADPIRLEQLLINLLMNAYKYGGDVVWLEGNRNGSWAEIVVCDNGSGLTQELVERAFEPFSPGEDVGGTEGSGLGLSIARGLAERCGGELRYERDHRGACFVVSLPAHDPISD